jgi:hypothetical protein
MVEFYESYEPFDKLRAIAFGNGGEAGIRTLDPFKGIRAFEARAFSRSATSPKKAGNSK